MQPVYLMLQASNKNSTQKYLHFQPNIIYKTLLKNKYKLKWTMTKKKTDKGECYVDDMPSVLKYYQLIYYPLFDKFFFNGFCFTQKNTPRKKWYNR